MLLGSGDLTGVRRELRKDSHAYRKARVRWAVLSDGDAPTINNIWIKKAGLFIQLNKPTGRANLCVVSLEWGWGNLWGQSSSRKSTILILRPEDCKEIAGFSSDTLSLREQLSLKLQLHYDFKLAQTCKYRI